MLQAKLSMCSARRFAPALTMAALVALSATLARSQDVEPNVVIQWNNAALQGVRDSKIGPPMVARALAIIHTCIYDAWAAYDPKAVGTQLGGSLRQPPSERGVANINKSISFAAYRASIDLFPGSTDTQFKPLMTRLGYDPNDASTVPNTPSGVGNAACAAVLRFRHNDGSNQLGDLTSSRLPYADYTGYAPVNPPTTVPTSPALVVDVNRWQPLQYVDASGKFVTPTFIGAHWYNVTPFALASGSQLRSLIERSGPALFGSKKFVQQAKELVTISAHLTDEQKMIAEYWADGPHSELPPGHWDLFAQFVSARDHHGVADDVKMFFAMTNAIFDGGIVAWDAKRAFDSVRPATAIPFLFQGELVDIWGGPFRGTVKMDCKYWIPYQPSTFPTPPFPEFISGHSTFSAAGAEILRLFTGSDRFGGSVAFPPGSSRVEAALVPAQPITLIWRTFTDAANQAGISRRYGGIHFKAGDLVGRAIGKQVADITWVKVQKLFRDSDDETDSDDSESRHPESHDFD